MSGCACPALASTAAAPGPAAGRAAWPRVTFWPWPNRMASACSRGWASCGRGAPGVGAGSSSIEVGMASGARGITANSSGVDRS